jgi:hypothetical protein
MEQKCNGTCKGETKVLGGKPSPVTLYPLQIPHRVAWDWTDAFAVTGHWDMAQLPYINYIWH